MRKNFKLNLQVPVPPPNAMISTTGFLKRSWSNGNEIITISSSDATELQAIALLWVARKESEEKYNERGLAAAGFMHHRNICLSLKKFLQKRKDRIQSSMPY